MGDGMIGFEMGLLVAMVLCGGGACLGALLGVASGLVAPTTESGRPGESRGSFFVSQAMTGAAMGAAARIAAFALLILLHCG